jgi:DNA polymerase III delta subunit
MLEKAKKVLGKKKATASKTKKETDPKKQIAKKAGHEVWDEVYRVIRRADNGFSRQEINEIIKALKGGGLRALEEKTRHAWVADKIKHLI